MYETSSLDLSCTPATLNSILPLSDVSAGLSQVGGKGASLARLAAAGLPVPPGFHITAAAYRGARIWYSRRDGHWRGHAPHP